MMASRLSLGPSNAFALARENNAKAIVYFYDIPHISLSERLTPIAH